MKSFLDFIKDTFWTLLLIVLGTVIFTLSLFLTFLFAYYGVIWAFLITIFFLPFHFTDFKNMFGEKNWIGIVGRFVCLYAISSFLGGYVAYTSGLMSIEDSKLVSFLAILSLVISLAIVPFAVILYGYFSHSNLYRRLQKIIDKLYKMEIFWRY